MVADTRFIDLNHLTHRFLVTHRLLLQCMKKPSVPKERKILHVIFMTNASVAGRASFGGRCGRDRLGMGEEVGRRFPETYQACFFAAQRSGKPLWMNWT